jgi:hypothetical protein
MQPKYGETTDSTDDTDIEIFANQEIEQEPTEGTDISAWTSAFVVRAVQAFARGGMSIRE